MKHKLIGIVLFFFLITAVASTIGAESYVNLQTTVLWVVVILAVLAYGIYQFAQFAFFANRRKPDSEHVQSPLKKLTYAGVVLLLLAWPFLRFVRAHQWSDEKFAADLHQETVLFGLLILAGICGFIGTKILKL